MDSEPTETMSLRERYEDLLHEVTKMRKKYPAACASYLSIYLRANADATINAEVMSNDDSKNSYQSEFLNNENWRKLELDKKCEPCLSKVEELQQEISNVREVLMQIKSTRQKNLRQ